MTQGTFGHWLWLAALVYCRYKDLPELKHYIYDNNNDDNNNNNDDDNFFIKGKNFINKFLNKLKFTIYDLLVNNYSPKWR